MQLVAWNVRGLNKVHKQKEAKLFIRTNNVSIIALLEHKIKDQQIVKVMKTIAPGWRSIDNNICSNKGRVWILWDPQVIKLKIRALNCKFCFTTIYGLHTIEARRSLWGKLRNINSSQQEPWISMGDYNAIHRAEDRMIGATFTWTNGHTYSIIDWALVNAKWMLDMQFTEVKILDPGCSDHSPLCITLMQEEDIRHKPFKFLIHLTKHENFQEIVQRAWKQRPSNGTMYKIWQKLRNVKRGLKELNNVAFYGVHSRIRMYRQYLKDVQSTMRKPG
ncbi:hypothetical protein R3W88_018659 [Solanum pinnatisectum]|uniref:Endonuclease/exonuclease/phosphatase domain-containing protein n=1 Tax=Solanum pinnatisectum TaxID=50273 RepID=A0AAV9L3V1_9SOLN|nr:hypothetical protein R3W88_018659 [Solanum pinnatisectum]